jgi:hypothetical protein
MANKTNEVTGMCGKWRIIGSDGLVEIERSSQEWTWRYVAHMLPYTRKAGITYTVERAVGGYWVGWPCE